MRIDNQKQVKNWVTNLTSKEIDQLYYEVVDYFDDDVTQEVSQKYNKLIASES